MNNETNVKEWLPINKGYSPTQFISPDGKFVLLTHEEWENGELKKRWSEIVEFPKSINKA